MLLDLANCPTHGWLSHAVYHEAGHAVAAIHLGFEFLEVVIPPPTETLRGSGPTLVAAGVLMPTNMPAEWVGERYQDAAIFLAAGAAAEELGFGHMLPSAPKGDMNVFVTGTPKLSDEEKLRYLATAAPLAQALVAGHREELGRVSKALAADIRTDEHGLYSDFDSPLRLSYDLVRQLVLGGT